MAIGNHGLNPSLKQNPYRVFFPIAVMGLICGSLIWLTSTNTLSVIPWHRDIMIGLFLLPLFSGFLMTAIPPFMAAKSASSSEIAVLLFLFTLNFLWLLLNQHLYFQLTEVVIYFVLFVFLFLRLLFKKGFTTYFFPLIILALAAGITGRFWLIISQTAGLSDLMGRKLVYHIFPWLIFISLSIKLFPMFGGRKTYSGKIGKWIYNRRMWFTVGVLFSAAEISELYISLRTAFLLRLVVIIYIAVFGWQMLRPVKHSNNFNRLLNLTPWLAISGHVALVIVPNELTHYSHVFFLSVFTASGILIGLRVFLNHEGLNADHYVFSWRIYIPLFLIYFAMLIRVTAQYIKSYLIHLEIAAITIVCAIIIVTFLALRAYFKNQSTQFK